MLLPPRSASQRSSNTFDDEYELGSFEGAHTSLPAGDPHQGRSLQFRFAFPCFIQAFFAIPQFVTIECLIISDSVARGYQKQGTHSSMNRRAFADVLHLLLTGIAVAVAALFVAQTAKVDQWAWTLFGCFLLGTLAALQLISSDEPPSGDPKKDGIAKLQKLAGKLGIWTSGSILRRLLTYSVLAILVTLTWLLGPNQLRQFGFECEGATHIQLTSGDDLKCDNATRQRLWLMRQSVTAGGECVWSDGQKTVRRALSVSGNLLRCESCRLRLGADCVSRPAIHALKPAVAAVVRNHARKNSVLTRLGHPTALEANGRAKSLGRVLVEMDARLTALNTRLTSVVAVGEVSILTGPGGSGKGPVMRYLSENAKVCAVDLADWRKKEDAGLPRAQYLVLDGQALTLPELPAAIAVKHDPGSLVQFLTSLLPNTTCTRVAVDSLDEFSEQTRRAVIEAALAWSRKTREPVVLAGRAEGFRAYLREDAASLAALPMPSAYVGDEAVFEWFLADYACYKKHGIEDAALNCDDLVSRKQWSKARQARLSPTFWGAARYFAYASAQANNVAQFVLTEEGALAENPARSNEAVGKLARKFVDFAMQRGEERHGRPNTARYRTAIKELALSLLPDTSGRLPFMDAEIVSPFAARAKDLLAFSSAIELFPPALDDFTAAFYPPILQLSLLCEATDHAEYGGCIRGALEHN
jgi:hypothetical protein